MSRGALFKETNGVAIEMTDRVFNLPPFHGNSSMRSSFAPKFQPCDADVLAGY